MLFSNSICQDKEAFDEDFWVPIRPNDNTRIDTLPGASNLNEIDDAKYFREKLYQALRYPSPGQDDPAASKISLSSRDIKISRIIEQLQAPVEDGLLELAERHLELRGYPAEDYEDLSIKLTPPSDAREMSRAEVITNRINNGTSLASSQILSIYDVYVDYFKYSKEEALAKLARLNLQKMQDMKLQIMGQNPQLIGLGQPGQGEPEIGTEPGGPTPMVAPENQENPPQEPEQPEETPPQETQPAKIKLSKPTPEDIKRFDLEILSYATDQDEEDIDRSNEN